MNRSLRYLIGAYRSAPVTSPSNRQFIGATYFFYYALLGIFVPYISVFLDHRGFSSAQIGLLLAAVAIARVVGPHLWANLSDKTGKIGELLRLSCLLAFICFLFMFSVDSYWLILFVCCAMKMFWTAALPQLEVSAIVSTKSKNDRGNYGNLRLWGSIGFIVSGIVAGLSIDRLGAEVVTIACAIALMCLYLSSLFVVAPNHTRDKTVDNYNDIPRLFAPVFIAFLLAYLLLQISFGAYNNFFALHMQSLGYKHIHTSLFLALGVAAEIIIFIYAKQMLSRFRVMYLILVSLLLTSLRWSLLAFMSDSILAIIFSQTLHAFSFGLTHAAAVSFLHNYFSKAFQSRAQAIYLSVSFGIGGALGSVITGFMWNDGIGALQSFVFSAFMALVAAFMIMFVIKKPINN